MTIFQEIIIMSYIQLEIGKSESELIWTAISKIENALGNVRRGMFSRHGELYKECSSLRQEIDELKKKNLELAKQLYDALFVVPDALYSGDDGLRSISMPASSLIRSSHSSSIGLSSPQK
jgi:hypothetical protein